MPVDESTDSAVRELLGAQRGLVVAPAGCGKTYLIAKAIASKDAPFGQLVLTHSHAGISAIKKQLRALAPKASGARVETISGWALRYSTAYPKSSGTDGTQPETHADWEKVYLGAAKLIRKSPIKDVVTRSYAGVFVDEYQDCSLAQHELVLALADLLPCRILGDPLQGVFAFSGSVNWESDVTPQFTALSPLKTPWRWEQPKADRELGRWLLAARDKIDKGEGDLSIGYNSIPFMRVRHTRPSAGDSRESPMSRLSQFADGLANITT